MTELISRVLTMAVLPKGDPIFSERCTEVKIIDESGGEFIEVAQNGNVELGKIQISPEEWPALRWVIDQMIVECRNVPD